MAGTNIPPGSLLKPVDINYAPDFNSRTVQLAITATNGSWVTTMQALDSPLDSLTYRLASNGNNAFAINTDTGEITVKDCTSFRDYETSAFTLTVQAQDSGYGNLHPRKSAFATVNVQILDNTPVAAWTGGADNDQWSAAANWVGAAPADRSRISFSGSTRATNVNDFLTMAGPVSLENGGFTIRGRQLLMLGGLTSTGDNTWAIDCLLNSSQGFTNVSGDLSLAGNINNNGKLLRVHSASTTTLYGTLSGQGGLVNPGPAHFASNRPMATPGRRPSRKVC